MGVTIPDFHIHSEFDLKESRKRLKGHRKSKEIQAHLTLTSMIDIFSVVVLFLIQAFSATGEVFMVNQGITLPQAYNASALARSPIVTITSEKVTIEGLPVGDNTNIQDKIEESDWDLPLLRSKLESYKTFAKNLFPDVVFPGEVIIQADSGLSFVYLKRVMYSLTKLGFTNINLAVRGEGKSTFADEDEDLVNEQDK